MTLLSKIFLAVTGLLAIIATASAAETAYLAKVNGVTIPYATFEHALSEARANGQPDTPSVRQVVAQRLIADELFWQQARKLKLHNTKEAAQAAEQARRQHAIGQFIQHSVTLPAIDEEKLKQRYAQILATLGTREYRISLIQTNDERALRDAAKRLATGADFAGEARRISQVASAQRGGAMRWLSFPLPPVAGKTNGVPLPVAEAMINLKPGEISAPLAIDPKTWALVRLDETRQTQIPDYAATRPAIIEALRAQSAASEGRDLAQRLIKEARIEWNPALKTVSGDAP